MRRPSALLLPLVLAAAVPGSAVAEDAEHTVTVSATGTTEQRPERAEVVVAIETTAATAQEATARNARTAEQVIAALKKQGIAAADVTTAGIDLWPEQDPDRPGRTTGYRAVHRLRVDVAAVDRAGAVVDAAIAAGANRVEGLSFDLADRDAAERLALTDAMQEARRRAETLAQAAGARVGPVIRVEAGTSGGGYPVPMLRTMEASTPVQPGTMTVSATVTVTYDLVAAGS